MYSFFRNGVVEREFPSVEVDGSVGVASSETVFDVSFDGGADGAELGAYLVVSACE